jgi:hypothetical protein
MIHHAYLNIMINQSLVAILQWADRVSSRNFKYDHEEQKQCMSVRSARSAQTTKLLSWDD